MRYLTNDGKIFNTIEEAQEHERISNQREAEKNAAYKKLVDAHKALEEARAEYAKYDDVKLTDKAIPDIWKTVFGL